jgi:hypothetical protein
LNPHLAAKVTAVTCLQLIIDWLLGVDRFWFLEFDLAVNDGRGLRYSHINLGRQSGLELFTCDVPLCLFQIAATVKRPDQAFFGFSALRI